ncbi:MAG: lysostaphin resistance A-like protein [Tenuifilaceae bacterium]
MKHLEIALDSQNQWWKYLIIIAGGFIAANLIGAIPLVIVISIKVLKSGNTIVPNPDNAMDLSVYGIDPNFGLILVMIPFLVALITVCLLFKPLHNRTFKQIINGTNSIRWNRFFFAVMVWGLIMGLYLLIDYMMNQSNYVLNFNLVSFLPLVVISLVLIPFQTTFEEIVFRGYLAQGIGAWTRNRWFVIIIPAVLFGLMHSFNPEIKEFGFWLAMPQYILYGLVFGLITVIDDGIEIAMGVHAINNIFSSIFVTYKASALQTPALFEQQQINPTKETIVLFIISLIFVTILSFKYKWDYSIINRKIVAKN